MSETEDMVERVARALWEAHRASIPANAEIPAWNGTMMAEYARNSYRGYARAAIEAMREGSFDVFDAGICATVNAFREDRERLHVLEGAHISGASISTVWHAIIDAALSPTGGQKL
jgi:hypothetical protein